jgi:prolipoprotein diacylglyceryltransferase
MELLQTLWRNLLVSLNLVTAVVVFFLVLDLGRRKAQQYTQSSRGLKGLDTWLIVGALLGGRIGAVVPEASVNLGSLVNLYNLNFGLSLYGAIGGGALALALFGWRRWKLTLALADVFSLYLPLGIGLFHLGCLMYGFCGGKPAPLPLGLPLPGHVGLRYPSELYEGVLAVGLFLGLLKLSQRGLPPGGVTGLFLLVYPLIRALVNLTRFPTGPWPWGDQVVSLVFAAVGLIVMGLAWTSQRSRAPSEISGVP